MDELSGGLYEIQLNEPVPYWIICSKGTDDIIAACPDYHWVDGIVDSLNARGIEVDVIKCSTTGTGIVEIE